MAELQTSSRKKNSRRKTTPPRVDLTPMVDLGFLLITFFMYTTTLARPALIELAVPPQMQDDPSGSSIPAEATLVLIPAANHRIAWYRADRDPMETLSSCGFAPTNGLRKLLSDCARSVAALPGTFSPSAHKLHVLIKPAAHSTYEDFVHCLDEMAINTVPYYSVMRPAGKELEALKKILPRSYGNRAGSGL